MSLRHFFFVSCFSEKFHFDKQKEVIGAKDLKIITDEKKQNCVGLWVTVQ